MNLCEAGTFLTKHPHWVIGRPSLIIVATGQRGGMRRLTSKGEWMDWRPRIDDLLADEWAAGPIEDIMRELLAFEQKSAPAETT